MAVIVISDTSCLCYLARLGCPQVLERLFMRVILPPAVAAELMAGVIAHPEIEGVLQADWLEVRTLEHLPLPEDFPIKLDEGEAEAIRLAEELRADHILMDEMKGRAVASDMGFSVIGLLGVLLKARKQGFVGPLKPMLSRLTDELGFRVHPSLVNSLLKSAGE